MELYRIYDMEINKEILRFGDVITYWHLYEM